MNCNFVGRPKVLNGPFCCEPWRQWQRQETPPAFLLPLPCHLLLPPPPLPCSVRTPPPAFSASNKANFSLLFASLEVLLSKSMRTRQIHWELWTRTEGEEWQSRPIVTPEPPALSSSQREKMGEPTSNTRILDFCWVNRLLRVCQCRCNQRRLLWKVKVAQTSNRRRPCCRRTATKSNETADMDANRPDDVVTLKK